MTPTVHLGVLLLELHIPDSQSLKAKRKVILSLKTRIRNKFNVSVAEVGDLDKWQRSVFGVSALSGDQKIVENMLKEVVEFAHKDFAVDVISAKVDYL